MSLRYRYPLSAAPPPLAVPITRTRRRVEVGDLRRVGDPRSAIRAAQTLVEFIEDQMSQELASHSRSRRSAKRKTTDPRLWLNKGHWLAWTICGELVSVEEIEPGSMRSSPQVRRLLPEELPLVFGAGRMITTVIALYRGDSFDRGPVWRYMAHHDLRRALEAALARAQRVEELLRVAATQIVKAPPARPSVQRSTKTRHHPSGNFIVYRRPSPGEDLPSYAAVLQLPPVPEAFPDRRAATRFLARLSRMGLDPTGLVVARIIGSVEVKPVWRLGIRVPREPEEIIELIQREPRVVLPELKAVWMPRYVPSDDGRWQLKQVQKRGTVRSQLNRILLRRVTDEGQRVAEALEDKGIRLNAGIGEESSSQFLSAALRVAQRGERRLPEAWLRQLGMQRESLGPDWSSLAVAAPVTDSGHWLRAPCEHGRPHSDGGRRRIVELRVDDVAELLTVAGLRPRFLLMKESTVEAPRWVLPVCASSIE